MNYKRVEKEWSSHYVFSAFLNQLLSKNSKNITQINKYALISQWIHVFFLNTSFENYYHLILLRIYALYVFP